MKPKDRIIVALDVPTIDEAKVLAVILNHCVGMFKVGLELLTGKGSERVMNVLNSVGVKVLYDGKFMDIPNTVASASREVARLGAYAFNVHACGGVEMMKAAVANKGACRVLAVTVLTSISDDACIQIYGDTSATVVPFFARMAKDAGVDGIICSPKELVLLKSEAYLAGMTFITPGIRPTWAAVGDQKRIMTPGEAVRAGADYVVVGRPITRPPEEIGSPVEAAKLIVKEIEEADDQQDNSIQG